MHKRSALEEEVTSWNCLQTQDVCLSFVFYCFVHNKTTMEAAEYPTIAHFHHIVYN